MDAQNFIEVCGKGINLNQVSFVEFDYRDYDNVPAVIVHFSFCISGEMDYQLWFRGNDYLPARTKLKTIFAN